MKNITLYLLCTILLSLPFILKSQPSWKWKNPRPLGNPISDVTSLSDNSLIAVGMLGTILRSDDSGDNWYRCDSSYDHNLTKVYFTDPFYGWIAGENGVILHSEDGGYNWNEQASGTEEYLTDLCFPVRDTGYVIGINSILLKTTDGGITWESVETGFPGSYYSLSFTDCLNGWIAAGNNDLLHTEDGGLSWELLHPHATPGLEIDLHTVSFPVADTGWVAGYDNPIAILKTTDGGITWEQQSNFTPICSCFYTTDISFQDTENGWISGLVWCSYNGVIFHTNDGGMTWNLEITWLPVSGIEMAGNSNGFAVGAGHSNYDEYLYPTSGCTEFSFIRKTDNNFLTSTEQLNESLGPYCNYLTAIDFPVVNKGYTHSYEHLYKTIDHGKTWNKAFNRPEFSITDASFIGVQFGVVVGESMSDSAIARTTDGGETWQFLYTGPGGSYIYLASVDFLNTTQGWILGLDFQYMERFIMFTSDGGVTWEKHVLDPLFFYEVFEMEFTDPLNGWFIDDYGSIMRTFDGGFHWTVQQIPSGYNGPKGLSMLSLNEGWISTHEGLLHTIDGTSWTGVNVNGAQYFQDVHFTDPLNGWTANDEGRIFRTSDGGNTWVEQERITVFPVKGIVSSGGDECWAVGQGGMILHLDDGLVSLNEIPASSYTISLDASPNPFSSGTMISYVLPDKEFISYKIFDLSGKVVYDKVLGWQLAGRQHFYIPATGLGNGVYILKLFSKGANDRNERSLQASTRLILQR